MKINTLGKVIPALLAMIITAGLLWYTHTEVAPRQVDWQDVQMEAREGGYEIIDKDELWARYRSDTESLLLVDTRQEWEYRIGHVDGAKNFPMEPTRLSRWQKKRALEKFLGPDKERFIVFY